MQDELLPIGKLSKSAGVSIDTIRHYDSVGLLKPAYISDESGYRYYSVEQIATLEKIRELKLFGFSLNEIKTALLAEGRVLSEMFQSRYWLLLQEKEQLQNAINQLSEKIIQCEKFREVNAMNKTVLLIDDSDFMRGMLTDIFTKNGYDIVGEAKDGLQGFEQYKKLKPDLVILDIAMPEHDGKWALGQLMDFDPNANVIMVSAVGHLQAVISTLIMGAKDFIVKPFQGDALIASAGLTFSENLQLNQIRLNHFKSDVSGDKILTQAIINKILHIARTTKGADLPPHHLEKELYDALKALGSESVEESGISTDNTALLRQLVEGQDRIINMLERMG